jgi:hypothetical protein
MDSIILKVRTSYWWLSWNEMLTLQLVLHTGGGCMVIWIGDFWRGWIQEFMQFVGLLRDDCESWVMTLQLSTIIFLMGSWFMKWDFHPWKAWAKMFQSQKCFSAKGSRILKHNLSFTMGGRIFRFPGGLFGYIRWDLSIWVGFFPFSTQVLLFLLALPTEARILCLDSL